MLRAYHNKNDVQPTAVSSTPAEHTACSTTQPHPGAREKKSIFGKPENIAELRVKSKQTLSKAVAIVTPHTAGKKKKAVSTKQSSLITNSERNTSPGDRYVGSPPGIHPLWWPMATVRTQGAVEEPGRQLVLKDTG